jgi:FkbM family methyltransferase
MIINSILNKVLSILIGREIKALKIKGPKIDFWLALYFPPDDYGKEIVSGGLLNESSYKFFVHYCSKMDVGKKVIDIGSNIGLYSVTSSKMGIETVGVEMDRHNFSLLKISKILNKLKTLSILNFAISTNTGLNYYSGESAWASITENIENKNELSVSPGLLLDTFYDQNIGIIKIDVEGNELDVLLSGELFLKSEQVDFIIEANILACGNRGYKIKKIFDLMHANGYHSFRIDHNNTLLEGLFFQEILYADYFFTKRTKENIQDNFGFTIEKLSKEKIRSNILQQLLYNNYHRLFVYAIREEIKTFFIDSEFSNLFLEIDIRNQESVIEMLKSGFNIY